MRHMHAGHVAIVVVLTLVAASESHSQDMRGQPTAAEIAALLRTHGTYGAAVSTLTQARSPQPRQMMDEIADTLLALAISFPGTDARAASTRGAAQSAIILAGMGSSGLVGADRATPYRGAATRLMQMAESAEDVGIRAAALWGLTQLPNPGESLPFLRRIAISQSPVAYRAVTLLARETGPEGQAIARELYRASTVTEPAAKEILDRVATGYQWR